MAIKVDRIIVLIFLISLLLSLSLSWVIYSNQDKSYVARFEIFSQSNESATSTAEDIMAALKKIEEDLLHPTVSPITKSFLEITPVFQRHTFSPPNFELKPKEIARFFGERLQEGGFFSNKILLEDNALEMYEFKVNALNDVGFGWQVNVLTTSPSKASAAVYAALDELVNEFYTVSSDRHKKLVGRQIEFVDLLIARAKADINYDLKIQSENKERDYATVNAQINALEAQGKSLSSNMMTDSLDTEISMSIANTLLLIEKIKLQRQAEAIINQKVVASTRSVQALSNLEKIKSALQEIVLQPLDVKQALPLPTQPILRISQNPIEWHQRKLGGIFVLSGLLGGFALGSLLSLLRLKLAKF